MPNQRLFLLEQRRLGSSFQAGEGLLPQHLSTGPWALHNGRRAGVNGEGLPSGVTRQRHPQVEAAGVSGSWGGGWVGKRRMLRSSCPGRRRECPGIS